MFPPIEPWWAKYASQIILAAIGASGVWSTILRVMSHREHKETKGKVDELLTIARNGNGKDH